MGRARRDRSAKEATFLEVVLNELRMLRQDLRDVKLTLNSDILDRDGEQPPPAPPPLDCYDRSYLMACRGSLEDTPSPTNSNTLPKMMARTTIEIDMRDMLFELEEDMMEENLTNFLRVEGHYDDEAEATTDAAEISWNEGTLDIATRIEISQYAAKFRNDVQAEADYDEHSHMLRSLAELEVASEGGARASPEEGASSTMNTIGCGSVLNEEPNNILRSPGGVEVASDGGPCASLEVGAHSTTRNIGCDSVIGSYSFLAEMQNESWVKQAHNKPHGFWQRPSVGTWLQHVFPKQFSDIDGSEALVSGALGGKISLEQDSFDGIDNSEETTHLVESPLRNAASTHEGEDKVDTVSSKIIWTETETGVYSCQSASVASRAPESTVRSGWPDFDATEQEDFMDWYRCKLRTKKEVQVRAMRSILDGAREAEAQGKMDEAEKCLQRCREIETSVNAPENIENMRCEAWRFLDDKEQQSKLKKKLWQLK